MQTLGVALIGTAFMGRMHSHAWRTAPRFFPLGAQPELRLLVGQNADRTADAATSLGWADWSTNWRDAIERDDIDVIDICSPGDTHAEIAIAALAAGKHVLCEKPLANSVADAERMAQAAAAAGSNGRVAMCGFSYRRTPALSLARRMISEGKLGEIRHVRAQYLQDWLGDPASPATWRLDKERAGSGALGDIGAHSIDLAQWLTDSSISGVSAMLRTFVTDRPALAEATGLGGTADESRMVPVTVDDAVAFTATFDNGAMGVFEATRMALGRKNANRIEINGDLGSVAFDFERMNELEFCDGRDADDTQGFRRIQVTGASHPYLEAWWPVGHGLGYEHGFIHQVVDFVSAVVDGSVVEPSFDQAVQVQRVLAAVESSAQQASVYTRVER